MTPWKRVLLLSLAVILFLYVGAGLAGPQWALIVCFLGNVLAAPFGQKLVDWIGHGAQPTQHPEITISRAETHYTAEEATTALLILVTNVYALLLINLMSASLIFSLDRLEGEGQLRFFDRGYVDAQIYVGGTVSFCVWLPALTVLSLALAGSSRRLSFYTFAAGNYLSVPIYFLVALSVGLGVGYTNPGAISILKGVGGVILLGLTLSAYSWVIAAGARKSLRFFGWKAPAYPH